MKWSQLTPRYIELNCDVVTSTGCWVWRKYIQSAGYGQIYIEGKWFLAHRMSWKVHKGEIPKGVKILHRCDNRPCCNPEHLFPGTSKGNTADCVAKGRAAYQQPGFDFFFTRRKRVRKLTDDQVRSIRKSKLPLATLSVMFDVSMATISNVRNGKRKQLVV